MADKEKSEEVLAAEAAAAAMKIEIGKLTERISGDEAKNRLKFNEQAALMLNIRYLHNDCKITVERGIEDVRDGFPADSYVKRHQENYVKNNLGPTAADLGAFLYKTEYTDYLFNKLDNKIFNILVPSIKLYKVFYPFYLGDAGSRRLDFSKSVSWKIPFNDSSLVNQYNSHLYTDEVLKTNSESDIPLLQEAGRLKGGGIKSFYYKYVGVNPAESNSNIEAELELYFEDITSFIHEITISEKDKRLLKKNKSDTFGEIKFKYSDLVVPSSVKSDGTIGPGGMTAAEFGEYFRIKIVAGYADPDLKYIVDIFNRSDIDTSTLTDPAGYFSHLAKLAAIVKKAIASAKICFFLTPYTHDINFNENGSITVKIKYIAAIEQIINDINILMFSDQYKKLVEENEKYRSLIIDTQKSLDVASCKQGKDVAEEKQRQANASKLELENKIDANNLSLYKDFYLKLFGLDPDGSIMGDSKIWEFKCSPSDIGAFGSEVSGYHNISKYSTKAVLLSIGGEKKRIISRVTTLNESEITELMTLTKIVISEGGIVKDSLKFLAKSAKEVADFFSSLVAADRDEYVRLCKEYAEDDSASDDPIFPFKYTDGGGSSIDASARESEEDKELADIIEEKILEATPDSFDAKEFPLIPIKFIYLGDIIDAILGGLDVVKNPEDKPRIILGSINLHIPYQLEVNSEPNRYNVLDINVTPHQSPYLTNIADIPISLRMFQSFFIKKIVREKRQNYSLLAFLYDLMYEVVGVAISPAFFGNFPKNYNGTNSFRLASLSATLPAKDPKKDAIFKQRPSDQKFSGNINPNGSLVKSTVASTYVDDEHFENTIEDLRSTNLLLTDEEFARSTLNYLIIYNSTSVPSWAFTHKGDADLDADLGVYHMRVGKDTGLVKSLNFSKTQNLYQKEALANREGTRNSSVLKDVYDVEITLFGNNIFRPGDFIYIEPLYLTGNQSVQLQNALGIGGYYQVVEVSTNLSDSKYETKINSVLYAHVLGEGASKRIVSSIKYGDSCDE